MIKYCESMSELHIPVPDYFELGRPMQPKRVVGDYVESQGILVPRRFETFEEAQFAARNGTPVIARSEHPDEYSGPSGLGDSSSFALDKYGAMKPRHYGYSEDPSLRYMHYALTLGIEEPSRYVAQVSESYWQVIPGINITCVADDAVEGRYHVFGHRFKNKNDGTETMVSGAIVEGNGDILRITRRGEEPEQQFTTHFRDIIDFYNQIRSLERFNPSHCPVMEMQLGDENQLYFLQYHRARDAAPIDERLNPSDYDERDGWIKAEVVRGAYLGGKALQLAMWYRGGRGGDYNALQMKFPEDGSTSMDYMFSSLDEFIGRKRIAHLIPSSFDREYDKIAANHGPRSRMFKPNLSMLTNPPERYDYIPEELTEEAMTIGIRENKGVRIKADAVSDGRIGYFRYGDELIITG